ncbi:MULTISPECIES: HigA family addiction module antitoxin [unclassified Microbacterium]|uniref:HigA family addiction module antitoxin n=1 Tax=unclassified Microbacterium TaxID=2609290 RepID=UPI000CFD6F1F|nr:MULTISPECIES: HigA family addiction module antitoxin [unclassified Microbacterium]PQZ60129.1 addiction module antidote protein, HigA family [Microbacterium sp. MYb43]PQZ79525.1 addiction module antidote protein, HigA family [Microbacterium sp. MYb40]PRB23172.1 addiction module antidote protein, HigA family [Microbacterium sp. MYb54]PRB27551.1 addiction module antidote protein, HigA family [Microbacterium sp. MYb50]PRB65842.1 addiction module antidote protein, HigA family [Microbacterium sp.
MSTRTNYAVAPGEYLAEWLEETGTTQQQAADRISASRKQINEIVNGRAPITAETAFKLGRLTGIDAETWLRIEMQYRTDLARLRDEAELAAHASKIPASTATYLRSLGATSASLKAPGKLVSDFLSFHSCGTWEAYEESVSNAHEGEYALAALTESKAAFDLVACSTWLRAGEVSEAYERGLRYTFDQSSLRNLIPHLRERAVTPDNAMLRDLAEMLASVGVVFAMVEPPKSFPLYGMTRWIDARVPMIQQSGRRMKDGFIIWTFFHELGHVLNDPRGETHFEFKTAKSRNTKAEKAANSFAFEALFGESGLKPFDGLTSNGAIARAAREVGVSPGVAVQQMHRYRKLPYNYGNQLLVDVEWGAA